MRTAILVLLLAVLSGAAVYEISNGFCVLKYNTFKQEFSVNGCYDEKGKYSVGFIVECSVKDFPANPNDFLRVEMTFSKKMSKDKTPVLIGYSLQGLPVKYSYTKFSEDIGNGKFGVCKISHFMDIIEDEW